MTAKNAIVVLTAESSAEIAKFGKTAFWPLRKEISETFRNDGIKYVICCRHFKNFKRKFGFSSSEEHRRAFLVGEISDIIFDHIDERGNSRFRIEIDHYSEIGVSEFWRKGDQRSAVYGEIDSLGSRKQVEEIKEKLAYDPGASQPFSRVGHSTDPQHAKIVNALRDHLNAEGYLVAWVNTVVSPDLVMTRDNKTFLFEIKPDNSPCAFYGAIGQVLIYSRVIKPYKSIVIAPSFPVKISDDFEAVLKQSGAELSRFEIDESRKYTFPTLSHFME